jgi:hypothetical protein
LALAHGMVSGMEGLSALVGRGGEAAGGVTIDVRNGIRSRLNSGESRLLA